MSIIRTLIAADWPQVQIIYQQGIDTGNATFETQAPALESLQNKYLAKPQLVAEFNDYVVGWAMLTAVSGRSVYIGVAEVSVYVASQARGAGIGRSLLERLVSESEILGFWTLQAGIFPENKASVAIHEQCGFRQVGYRERLAKQNGIWRDVLLLERRSKQAGND